MKLKLDGKEIGEIADGKVVAGGKTTGNEDKRETMQVPVVRLDQLDEGDDADGNDDADEGDNTGEGDDNSDSGDENDFEKYLDTLDPRSREFVLKMSEDNTKLTKQVRRMTEAFERNVSTTKDDADDIDEIGDIPKEKDPFGVARTLRKMSQRFKSLETKVTRLDQHTGFKEAQQTLEVAKSMHPVFKDKTTRVIAEKLLEAELKTNRTDSIQDMVASVVRDVKSLGITSAKTYVRDKNKTAGKVPAGVLRAGDGTTPAITVQKPRNIKESAEAYKVWRTQNARANRR